MTYYKLHISRENRPDCSMIFLIYLKTLLFFKLHISVFKAYVRKRRPFSTVLGL